jgi:hypothetical protein
VNDPTYVKEEIEANPVWYLAWVLSEVQNDRAPLGWSEWVYTAECLLAHFTIVKK